MLRKCVAVRIHAATADAGTRSGVTRIAARRALTATVAVVLWFAALPAGAETATPATPPVAATPPATVTESVTNVIASEDLQRATLARLEQAGRWQELGKRATALEQAFEGLAASPGEKAELIDVITLARQLHTLRGELSSIVNELESTARQLEHDRAALDADARKWRERLSLLDGQHVPPQILERARSTEAKVQSAGARIRVYQDNALLDLDRSVALLARVDNARARAASQEERIRAQRLQFERASLWQLVAMPAHFDIVADQVRTGWRLLGTYLSRDGAYLAGLFLGVLALTGWLFIRGARQGAGAAQRAYGQPLAASLLIALMAVWWLAPDPPTLFYEALLLLLPIPAAMLAGRVLAAPIHWTLYGIAAATILIPIRLVIEASAVANRSLLLLP